MKGWLDKYDDGGEVKTPKRTALFNQDTLTLPNSSYAKYRTNEEKSRLKGTSDDPEINKAADWLTNWYSSKGAKQRLAESLKTEDPRQVLQDAKDNINNVYVLRNSSRDLFNDDIIKDKSTDFNSLMSKSRLLHSTINALKNEENYMSSTAGDYTAGFYTPDGHIINITPGLGDETIKQTSVHELTHASNLDQYYNNVGKDILKKRPLGVSDGMPLFPINTKSKKFQKDSEYIKRDGAYPRLMEMRYNSKINPNQVITPEQFKTIKKENPKNDLFRYYTDYDIINMLNHFAANDKPIQSDIATAEYGAELNYNDYSVSAPEGFVGEGYSNRGRNYSPAWGGQFADGGELPNVTVRGKRQPIVVTNPKDHKLKAYQDSLALYNEGEKNYKARLEFNKKNNIPKSSTRKWNDPINYDINKKGDMQLSKIQPIEGNGYWYNEKPDNVVGTNIPSRLTDNYGFRYKKPTQPVIYQKPQPTPQSTIDFMEGNYAQEPITEVPQQFAPSWGEVVDPRTGYKHLTRQGTPMYPLVGQNVPEMAMGGSMPGAVGFTYARVAGSAPSKGNKRNQVYKTDASAQNGTEMRYYQEGLDFKPKTISEDGSNVAYADNTRVGNLAKYQRPVNYRGQMPDTLGENIFEIVDPSGISSWDDIYRSAIDTGMSGQTALEVAGAIPFLGKFKKAGQFLDIVSKAVPMTGRQAKNVKASVAALKAVGKYGPNAGRATDAYQAYDQYEQGGQLTKLDQLTNFTNYNTKQPGGWLDKYEG